MITFWKQWFRTYYLNKPNIDKQTNRATENKKSPAWLQKLPYWFFAYLITSVIKIGLSCWLRCLLALVFFLFRVCVKKSTQERLALKILIDRPKARNEVRGNTVAVVINAYCLWLYQYALSCLPACYQSLLIPVFLSSSICLPCFFSVCSYRLCCL